MSGSGDCIFREDIVNGVNDLFWNSNRDYEPHEIILALHDMIADIPAADVIDEKNVLKFYYVRSTDDYWIGQRVGNFYYAEFDPKAFRWAWTHSRYLPWGEHVVSPTSLWKEHTYPSKPEEIPFGEWLRGFIKKYFTASDVRPVVNTCETCGYKTEQIRVKPYDGACCYWKLHSIKNEEWCCHWKQREES